MNIRDAIDEINDGEYDPETGAQARDTSSATSATFYNLATKAQLAERIVAHMHDDDGDPLPPLMKERVTRLLVGRRKKELKPLYEATLIGRK